MPPTSHIFTFLLLASTVSSGSRGTPSLNQAMLGLGLPVTEAQRVEGPNSVTWESDNRLVKRGATEGRGGVGGSGSGAATKRKKF